MITTIIFDIGNVLADFVWEEHYRSFGYDEETFMRIAKATVKNPAWNEYDRGILTDEEVMQEFIKSDPELEDILRKVLKSKKTMVRRNDYAIP